MEFQELLHEPVTWVVVSFVVFVTAVFRKAKKLILGVLDERSIRIAEELKRAQSLREEAEAVLALYKQKQAEYTKEAEAILRQAREDADHMAAHADRELKAALDARMQAALEEIAQEEVRAINEVRGHVVDISLAAARALVLQNLESIPQVDLLKLALADLDRKIH